MPNKRVSALLREHFPHEPTADQDFLIDQLGFFLSSSEKDNLFIIKGYAGTGKTTAVRSIVDSLPALRWKSVLLAPTGRAAKVLASYSGKQAFTIHKKIYRPKKAGDGIMGFARMENKHTNTIFIVDEASMISGYSTNSGGFGQSGNLLEDLLDYVYNGVNCRLILIGDTAQLPPVGHALSQALDEEYLQRSFHVQVKSVELKQVVRQDVDSGILANATRIRELLASDTEENLRMDASGFPDFERVTGEFLQEALQDAYDQYGPDQTLVVCRSNKRANAFNQQIRARIRWQESDLEAGDHLMVVRNNYFWLDTDSKAGFIANGDILEVLRIQGRQELYGFDFADVTVRMVDYPDEPNQEFKVMLDSIAAEGPGLPRDRHEQLYKGVLEDYMDIPSASKRQAKIKKDPFYQALEIKFAYAVTCHKAQGGQWDAVFVDQGYLPDDQLGTEYYRWLYTAITRASKKVYLVNFRDSFF